MNREEYREIIRKAHSEVAPHYGVLDIHGKVLNPSLAHWNYVTNFERPLGYLIKKHMKSVPFVMLDAGCGNGQLFHFFHAMGAAKIYGADFSASMLEEAGKRASVNHIDFTPIHGDLEDLSFLESDFFDLVNLFGVIEHLYDPLLVLRNLTRIIKRGGLFVFSVPRIGSLAWLTYFLSFPSLEGKEKRGLIERLVKKRKMSLYRFYAKREVVNMIESLGDMAFIERLPVGHSGLVSSPARMLEYLGRRGKYTTLNLLERSAKGLGFIPAGEYVVLRKL